MKKKGAVIGCGLAGLAMAYFLLERGWDVTSFAPRGEGASYAATGLMHPFPSRKMAYSHRAGEGIAATLALADLVEDHLGRAVTCRTGCVKQGIFIPEGVTMFPRLYLQGLSSLIEKKGGKREEREITSLDQLFSFDLRVIAAGASLPRFCPSLDCELSLGEALLCTNIFPLTMAIIGKGHLNPTEDSAYTLIGSTYERGATEPTIAKRQELLDEVISFYPAAKEAKVIEVRTGIRLKRIGGYRPYLFYQDDKTIVFGGLGSRGFLYHALLAKEQCALL